MSTKRRERNEPLGSLEPYPNLHVASNLIGVASSTLSRREDLRTERRGERDRVLSPSEVLRLAVIYRKRSLNDVAHDLIAHAASVSREDGLRVEHEVDEFFDGRVVSAEDLDTFLSLASLLLPSRLYDEVERATRGPAVAHHGVLGDIPVPRSSAEQAAEGARRRA